MGRTGWNLLIGRREANREEQTELRTWSRPSRRTELLQALETDTEAVARVSRAVFDEQLEAETIFGRVGERVARAEARRRQEAQENGGVL